MIRILIATLGLIVLSQPGFSQSDIKLEAPDNPNHVTVQVGQNVVNLFMDRIFNEDVAKYSSTKKIPIMLGYERLIVPQFGVGVLYARQEFNIQFEEYIDENGFINTGKFDANIIRNQFYIQTSLRIPMEKLTIYTQTRLGISNFNVDVNADKADLKFIDRIAGRTLPSAGWTAIGINLYPVEQIGINAHVNLGAPDIVGGGLVFRF